MTDHLTELRAKWDTALASGATDREWRAVGLSVAAPVRLLAAVRDQDSRISILVETPLQHAPKHRVRFQAEGISIIDERWIEDGLLRLAVTLERPDLRDIYEVLAIDVISVAANRHRPTRPYRTSCAVWKLGRSACARGIRDCSARNSQACLANLPCWKNSQPKSVCRRP